MVYTIDSFSETLARPHVTMNQIHVEKDGVD